VSTRVVPVTTKRELERDEFLGSRPHVPFIEQTKPKLAGTDDDPVDRTPVSTVICLWRLDLNRDRLRRIANLALSFVGVFATASCNNGSDKSSGGSAAAATCTSQQPDTASDIRLYLSSDVLSLLQQRAAANDPTWVALKAHCDGLTGGTFNLPSGNAYPDFPNVGQGYEGDGYLPEIRNLGLCYRVAPSPTDAARYGAAGAQLLMVIATPAASGGQPPNTDDGYGIRNYGVGMAVGYDWLRTALSAEQKQSVITSLNAWIDWYDANGFSNSEPVGNYFAGYLLAKATAAIATDTDNPNSASYWSDVQTRMWGQLAQPAYSSSMLGGGWPEGWEYGPLAVEEMAELLWAVKTGKGVDWSSGVPLVHDEAMYVRSFAWPSLMHMDDQGTIHSQTRLAPSVPAARSLAGILQYNGDSLAASARSFLADLIAANGQDGDPWEEFLYGDPTLPTQPYSSDPLSYFASGSGQVSVRSAWQKDAVWGSFVAGPYVDAPDSGEQSFNQGAIAIVQGDQPIIVNATGWLPQAGGEAGETFVYDDTWGSKTRLLYNTFYASGATQQEVPPGTSQTHVVNYEDTGVFVHARGTSIADMYAGSSPAVSQVTRDLAYLRPGTFVVYDRTTVGATADQWLAWHTPTQPTSVTVADSTQSRFDVAAQGATIGSIRTLLPQNTTSNTVNLVSGAAWRLEMHAPTQGTTQDWLTVVTAGNAVPDQTRLSSGDGNVLEGSVVGVHVLSSPRNAVVLFASDHTATATTSATTYVVAQNADADHVLYDMAPSATGYSVSAAAGNGGLTIAVAQGGPFALTAHGTLSFSVSQAGAVTASPAATSGTPPAAGSSGTASPGAGSGASSGATQSASSGTASGGATSGTAPSTSGSATAAGGTAGASASATGAMASGASSGASTTCDGYHWRLAMGPHAFSR
jgi:hypothetical protein